MYSRFDKTKTMNATTPGEYVIRGKTVSLGAFSMDITLEGVLVSVTSLDFSLQKWIYDKTSISTVTTDKTAWECDMIESR
jgi:hypothetical protein